MGLLFILLSMTQYSHLGFLVTLLASSCVAHLLSLGILGPFSNSAFSWAFSNSFWASLAQLPYLSSLGLMDFPLATYFLYLHYFEFVVAHFHFSTSYTVHEFATSLFRGFFRPVCFLKAHLFILWAQDPLFLPLGL